MKVWGYVALAGIVVGALTSLVYGINKYIDKQVDDKYQVKMLEYHLDRQNQAILENSINTDTFNKNAETLYKEIEDSVPIVVYDSGEKCEVRIEKIDNMLELMWD